MSNGPLEEGWLGDLIMRKLSKAEAYPWGLAVYGEVLPQVKSQNEWVADLWLGNLCSAISPGISHVFSGASSAYPDLAKMVHPGLCIWVFESRA